MLANLTLKSYQARELDLKKIQCVLLFPSLIRTIKANFRSIDSVESIFRNSRALIVHFHMKSFVDMRVSDQ